MNFLAGFIGKLTDPITENLAEATKKGVEQITHVVTESLSKQLLPNLNRIVQGGASYLAAVELDSLCSNYRVSFQKYCESAFDDISCFATKSGIVTACSGSWLATATTVYIAAEGTAEKTKWIWEKFISQKKN